jgi:sec-independent protein translocase protein TatA
LVVELFAPWHLIVVAALAFILFFGWKQLPDMARSAGRSLRVFRTEIKGLADDDAVRATKSALSSATEAPEPPSAAPVVAPPMTPTAVPPTAVSTTPADDVAASDAQGKPAG